MVVLFSDHTAVVPAAWPWAGFTPHPTGLDQPQDASPARFHLMPAAPFLAGHFPGRPILPGVAVIDAALMTCRAAAGNSRLRLAAISGARFLATVLPGDELTLQATQADAGTWRMTASAGGTLCARMTLHVTESEAAPRRAAAHGGVAFDLGPADIALRLPQRAPMLMLEGAMRLPDGRWAMHGRPHSAIIAPRGRRTDYPKSLICEGFFQAAGLALEADFPAGAALLLGTIGRAEFAAVPHASEAVRHIVTNSRPLGDAALVAGETRTLDDTLVATYTDVLVVVRSTSHASTYTA
jgi:3-hydroxymyristoyl/3-hydroxydecanoyl-(acyl carrier protein) dehydratase